MSHDLTNLVCNLGHPKVMVIGDIILDRYIFGSAERISQEAPVILLHEDTQIGGFAGELAAIISEEAFEYLDGPIRRITAPNTPVPYSPPLEEFFLPKVSDVLRVARELYAY